MGEHFGKVGAHLDRAVGAYNETVGSLENRVLVSARRFQELGVAGGDRIEEIPLVERATRKLRAPETANLEVVAGIVRR